MAQKLLPSSKSYIVVRKQVIQKEKLLKESLAIQKKTSTDNRKNSERERNLDNERKVEKSFSFLGKGLRVPKIPKLGLFDSIKRFITNVLMGYVVVRLLKYLPQMMQVFQTMLKVGDFIISVGGSLLNGLISFVDWGYKAYDNARGLVGNINRDSENAISNFDSSASSLNSTLNQLFIAGMIFTDFGGVGTIGSAAVDGIKSGIDFIKDRLSQQAVQRGAQVAGGTTAAGGGAGATAGTAGGVAAGTAAAVIGGAGLLASALGEGAFQLKRFGKGFGGWISKQEASANRDKNPVTRFLKKGFFGWMQKTLGPSLWLLNGLGVTLDILGAPFRYGIELIRFGIMKIRNNQKGMQEQAKNLGKFDARVRDGMREHFSVLSPILRMAGMKGFADKLETPGSFGSLYGEKAVSDMGYRGGGVVKIKKFAGGGATGGTEKDKKADIPRTLEKSSSALNPGSSIGGNKKIQDIFPYSSRNDVMNPYEYLTSAHSTLGSSSSIGPMLGLMIKVLLGDRVDNNEYKNIASSLNNMLLYGLYEENLYSYNRLTSNISTSKLTTIIEGSILKILDERLDAIQNELRVQLGLAPIPGGTDPTADECAPCEGGTSAAVSGDAADKAVLDLIASVESDGYDSVNTSAAASIGRPTQMTIDEIGRRGRGATGRYQHMPEFLVERAIAAGVKPSEKFTPENQDKITLHFLRTSHGYERWKSGQMSDKEFAQRLAATWRGLPYDERNQTYPDQYAGRNKAHTTFANVLQSLQRAKTGASPANIAPGSSAASATDSCVCDPKTPDGNPGEIQSVGPGDGKLRFGRTGTLIGMAPGWAHAHFENLRGGMTSQSPTEANVSKLIQDIMPLVKKMADSGLKPELSSGKPILPRKDSEYYSSIIREGVARHTHSGPKAAIDINMPGFPLVPFPLRDVRNTPYKGEGINALVANSTSTALYHMSYKPDGSAFIGGYITGKKEKLMQLHKGEYVIDKDSVDVFGGRRFYDLINRVENDSQRAAASRSLIQHLSQYTGRKIDQRPEIIVDDNEDEILMMPPTYYVNSMGSSGSSGEEVNPEQDMCYARG